MPRKGQSTSKSRQEEESEDEWEEQIMIAQLDGVLDASLLREAVEEGKVNLRHPESDNPLLQIGNSLYTGHWSRSLGTHIILQAENQQLKMLSVNGRMLKTEKALLTSNEEAQPKKAAEKKGDAPSTSKS